jgi:cytochrome c553
MEGCLVLLGILPFDTSGVSRAIPFSLVQTTVCDGSCLAKPADDGRTRLVARGRTIYQDGIPDSNIPSCVACHGPSAQGAAAQGAGQIPRLGGLSYHYLKRRLEQWGEGYDAAAPRPMPEIAIKLSVGEIDALASYLSFVR